MRRAYGTCFITLVFALACGGKHFSDDDDNGGAKDNGSGAATGSGGSGIGGSASGAGGSGTANTTPNCNSGYARCGSACVDLDFDQDNCGTCGHRCASGETCRDGLCATTGTDATGGTGATGGTTGTAGSSGTGGSPGLSCTSASYPVSCPALGAVPAQCWSPGTVCSTVTSCSGQFKSCSDKNDAFDCSSMKCLSKTSGGTGGGGGGGTGGKGGMGGQAGSATASATVTCSYMQPVSLADPQCSCDSTAGTPATYTGQQCGESGSVICCATNGYPTQTGGCKCYDPAPYSCLSFGATTCSCTNWSSSVDAVTIGEATAATVCNDTPDSDGTPWGCCGATDGSAFCQCISNPDNDAAFCSGSGVKRVHDCTDKTALGIANSVESCPSGTTSTSTCSMGLAGICKEDSDCPGDNNCTFAGDVGGCCMPVCNTSHRCDVDCFDSSF